jgi:hypothetical protein
MMNATELFLKTVDAYKAWIATGMNHREFAHLYEAWDEAVLAYAQSMGIARRFAADHVFEAVKRESR